MTPLTCRITSRYLRDRPLDDAPVLPDNVTLFTIHYTSLSRDSCCKHADSLDSRDLTDLTDLTDSRDCALPTVIIAQSERYVR